MVSRKNRVNILSAISGKHDGKDGSGHLHFLLPDLAAAELNPHQVPAGRKVVEGVPAIPIAKTGPDPSGGSSVQMDLIIGHGKRIGSAGILPIKNAV
jgi:hypothetical protein